MNKEHMKRLAEWLAQGETLVQDIAASMEEEPTQPGPEPDPAPEDPGPEPEPEPPVTGPGPDLPTLILDKQRSVEAGNLRASWPNGNPAKYHHMPKGCIIQCDGEDFLPAANWTLKLDHNAQVEPGAELHLRGAKLKTPGNQLCLSLYATHNVPRIKFVLDECHLIGGAASAGSGYTLSIPHACDVEIYRTLLEQGYDCLAAANADTNILMESCDLLHGAGIGNGKGHNLYVNFIRSLVMRGCTSVAPRSMGHAVKVYAERFVMDDCELAHTLAMDDIEDEYFGTLPLLDRGGFGQSLIRNNRFYREAPDARPHFIELRNRRFAHSPIWPGEPDYQDVDNRDRDCPHLLHHFFAGNEFHNQVDGGVMLRNNGTAPDELPVDWKQHNHRSIAWMVNNQTLGNSLGRLYDREEYKRPAAGVTPIHQIAEADEWMQQKMEEIENG